jgi:glycosyltransferase involved in cell wall biosynthesis
VVLTGWTYDPRLETLAVVVTIDGVPRAAAETGLPRRDITKVRKRSAATHSGFAADVDLAPYAGREIVIGGHAVRANGIADRLREVRVTVPPSALRALPIEGPHRERAAEAMGALDLPEDLDELVGDVAYVRGWCLFPGSRVASVEIELDGISVGRARLHVDSLHVTKASRHVDASVAAFEMHVVLDDAPRPSEVVVNAVGRSLDGRTWHGAPRRLVLAPREPDDDAGRARLLVERTDAAIHGVTPQGDGVLVFTHELSLGGAQLWLWDLVRQIHGRPGLGCTVVAKRDGLLRRRLESIGIEVQLTEPARVDSPDAYEGRVRELAMLACASGCRAALVNTLPMYPAADAAQRAGLPTIWAIHESYPLSAFLSTWYPDGVHPHVRQRLEHALSEARALVFEARQTSDLFAPYCPQRRRFVVEYGIDLNEIDAFRASFDRAEARERAGIAATDTVVLATGVFEARKAHASVLAALHELADVHPDLRLVLVGARNSAYTRAVLDQAARSGLGHRVEIVDVTPDIYSWYGISDLFLCASDLESLPRSVLEAMAFGIPVLATDAWGLPDLIRDGENGWLTSARDFESLVGALHRILELDRAEWAEIGAAARDDLERNRSVEGYARAIGDALRIVGDDPNADLSDALGKVAVLSASPEVPRA